MRNVILTLLLAKQPVTPAAIAAILQTLPSDPSVLTPPRQPEEGELERARDERETEDEMEDVGLREELRKRAPLGRLAANEASRAPEGDVGLRVERVALEDHEPRVDAAAAERFRDGPRHARGVDGAEGDAQRGLPGGTRLVARALLVSVAVQ